MTIKLRRTGDGGYATPDGRYTVRPIIMGTGVNGNGGWSPGRREWEVTAPEGVRIGGRFGPPNECIAHALHAARDIIEHAQAREEQA